MASTAPTDSVLALAAQLSQEEQPSTLTASGPGPTTGEQYVPSSTTPATINPSGLKGANGSFCDSLQEPTPAKLVVASGYAVKSNSSGSSGFLEPLGPSHSGTSGLSFSCKIPQAEIDFANGQSVQSRMNITDHLTQGWLPSVASFPGPVSQHSHPTATVTSSNSNFASRPFWSPSDSSFQVPQHGSRATASSNGVAPAPSPSNVNVQSSTLGSSSAQLGSVMPTSLVQPNPSLQQQMYTSYATSTYMAPPPQGLWFPLLQGGGFSRPPLLPYPSALPNTLPLPSHGMPLPSAPPSDSCPPGVTHTGNPVVASILSGASDKSATGLGVQLELPPGIENNRSGNDVSVKDESAPIEQFDAWSAHRTATGAIYYYNALTGESTYQKPSGFKGEPDKMIAQPTPVSWEKCAGTDWSLVTTNDGKRYYHNTKTKVSSWQIPNEVTELRKRQDGDALKELSMSVPNSNMLTEKGSVPLSLSAPAVNTGGRDATALRTTGAPVSSFALDLIKKKLQESGAPVTSLPVPVSSGPVPSEFNGSTPPVEAVKGSHTEICKDKLKDGNLSDTSSDSDVDGGPTKEECTIQFKEMLKERGVAPFSKWEKELPKIVFDPRFKAIPSHSARRALFEHYVRTRAEEERKEKRAAQKAAIEGYKQLLEEAKEEIDHNTDYHTFKKKWGHDPRFEALDRKDREILLNERVVFLKKSVEEEARAIRAAAVSSFKSMLQDKGDITTSSRWSKVKDTLRNDPRYKSVKHEDREALFNEYISELRMSEDDAERVAKAKRDEEEKLKERERALRKRKEREEQEVERVRSKARRKEAIESYQALLVEMVKDPQVSWKESKPKLEKDPQGRAGNPYLDQTDLEKLFREHVKVLHERCTHEFRALLAEVITAEAALQETEDGKTVATSWSTAKRILKTDPRYAKMPKKEKESLWRRHVEELQRRQKVSADENLDKDAKIRSRSSVDSGKYLSGSRRIHER